MTQSHTRGQKVMTTRQKVVALVMLGTLAGVTLSGTAQRVKEPVDYIAPNIGTIGQLLSATIPLVQYPHGMASLAPVTTPGITDRYLADKIFGFPVGPALLMASEGQASTVPDDFASEFDHDFEVSTPYYYEADLLTWGIKAELTATPESAYYRFTYPAGKHSQLLLSLTKKANLIVFGDSAVGGSERVDPPIGPAPETGKETRAYFYAEFSTPLSSWQTLKDGKVVHDKEISGDRVEFIADRATTPGEQVGVRVGLSYISVEQAHRNLDRKIPRWDFDGVKAAARTAWNRALGAIRIEGGSDRQRTIFYTALYRSLGRMTDITEDGRYFSGYDHAVHDAQGHDFYIDDGTWDTYRSLHPLQLLLDARQQEDMVRSYVRMYEQSGWLPSFPSVAGEQAVMIGHHAIAFIVDTYMKGHRDFDVEQAYAAMRKSATDSTMLPWSRGPLTGLDRAYFEKGFFPALESGEQETVPEVTTERRQAVSVTLESSYDDWCLAQFAKALGKQADALYFSKLALNYENVFNGDIGFMAPKSADGKWVEHFGPTLGGVQGGRN